MNKNRKKGFTLVELLVVIAILAILAVVSVVGYTSFTKKAKIADDISLTTQMNTILDADSAGGSTYETPSEAVDALIDGGLIITKLTPTTENYTYVLNINGKLGEKVLLLDENYEVKSPADASLDTSDRLDYFTFVSTSSELNKYTNDGFSVYLKDDFNSSKVEVKTGIDVGNSSNVNDITYESSSLNSVLIRTTTGKLTINGPSSSVKHYGESDNIIITSVASKSYHEYGKVLSSLEVSQGRVVIEPKASVKEVNVTSEAKSDTKVEVSANSTVETLVVDSTAATVEVKDNAKIKDVICANNSTNVTIPTTSGVTKTQKAEVKDYSEFVNALTNKAKYITFTANITDDTTITMNNVTDAGAQIISDTIIDGMGTNGECFTFSTTHTRGIVTYVGGINVTIKNLKISQSASPKISDGNGGTKDSGEYTRAIQVNEKNTILSLDNVEILTSESNKEGSHYGINVVAGASVELTVLNSTIRGYGAMNLWGANYNVTVSNSTLEGINTYGTNTGDSSSNFAVICLDADWKYDNELKTWCIADYEPSYLVSVTLTNCTIKCITTGTCTERPISFYGYNGTVSLINTNVITDGASATKTCLTYDGDTPELNNKLIVEGITKT